MEVLSLVKLTKGRAKICLAGGADFVLYKKEYESYGIEEGADLPEDKYQEIITEIIIPRCKKRALHLLEKQDRSEKNLRDKLREGGYSEDVVDIAIDYINEYGYLDDARMAASHIRFYQDSRSKQRLKQDLIGKGISSDVIDRVLEEEYTGDESALIDAYNAILPYTHKNYIIVEEYLEGEEFGAQAFVCEGRVLFVMPHSDEVYHGKTGVPIGHHVPFMHDNYEIISRRVYLETEKAINALGIDNAAVNVDMILVNDIPYILEIGARAGGTCLPELVALHYNIDYYKMIIEVAAGSLNINEYVFKPVQAATGLLITSQLSGVIKNYDINIKDDCIYDLSMDYKKGHHIRKFETGPDRIGQLIVYGNNAKRNCERAFEILSEIRIDITPSSPL